MPPATFPLDMRSSTCNLMLSPGLAVLGTRAFSKHLSCELGCRKMGNPLTRPSLKAIYASCPGDSIRRAVRLKVTFAACASSEPRMSIEEPGAKFSRSGPAGVVGECSSALA